MTLLDPEGGSCPELQVRRRVPDGTTSRENSPCGGSSSATALDGHTLPEGTPLAEQGHSPTSPPHSRLWLSARTVEVSPQALP